VEDDGLDPAATILWMLDSQWPCNIALYPAYIKNRLETRGGGLERLKVHGTDLTFMAFGPRATIAAFHAFTAGGTLRKIACRTRPYELVQGSTDALVERAFRIFKRALEAGGGIGGAYEEALSPFLDLEISERNRPQVAIFGDFYARDNDVLNQGLVRSIEKAGGEVVTSTYTDYLRSTIDPHFRRLLVDRRYGQWAVHKTALAVVGAVEQALSLRSSSIFGKPRSWHNPGYLERLDLFGIKPDQEGESFDNILEIFRVLSDHPELSLFVQASPAFCCPSIITEAMSKEIERVTGVPVVSITYDGTGTFRNDAVEPYLAFGRRRSRTVAAKADLR
ncbi:MAG: hypothetical protein M0001_11240, partial [Treponema sp.]|nr:hypothetical protein [Treponema sp.]